jgi:hypothetical protein
MVQYMYKGTQEGSYSSIDYNHNYTTPNRFIFGDLRLEKCKVMSSAKVQDHAFYYYDVVNAIFFNT